MTRTRLMSVALLVIGAGFSIPAPSQESGSRLKVHNLGESVSVYDCTRLGPNTSGCFQFSADERYYKSDGSEVTYVYIHQTFSNSQERRVGSRTVSCQIPARGFVTARESGATVDVTLSTQYCESEGDISDYATNRIIPWPLVNGERLRAELTDARYGFDRVRHYSETQQVGKVSVHGQCREWGGSEAVGRVEFTDVAFAVERTALDSRIDAQHCNTVIK
jgi:hypothetical protein